MVEFLYFGDPNFERYFVAMLDNSFFCSPFYSNIAQKYFLQRPKDEGTIGHDKSFIMLWENEPVISFRGATVEANGKASLLAYEMPCISIEDRANLTAKAVKSFLEEFEKITEDINGNIWFRDFLIDCKASYLSTHLLSMGARANTLFSKTIDLKNDKSTRKSSIRKSYKSLINWGNRELQPKVFDASDITWELMNEFRLLHIRVSGRETRSEESWRRQFEMVEAGEAFVVFGRLDNELVSAGLFTHNKTNCYYQVSASKREMFEKPLFHSLMWMAILHAKKIDCKWFEIGEQHYPNHPYDKPPTKKELGISEFKAGFGGETRILLDLELELRIRENENI
jgi:FemAB family protein